MYSEASIVVTFPCLPRIFAEFGMAAFALCSATSFGVFHIFFAWGWMQEFTFLTYHAVSTRRFFLKITNCVDFFSCCLRSLFWGSSVVAIFSSLLVESTWWVSCSLSLLCDLSSSARSLGVSSVFTVLLYFPLLACRYRLGHVGFLCWYYYCSNPWTGVLCLSNEVLPIVQCNVCI